MNQRPRTFRRQRVTRRRHAIPALVLVAVGLAIGCGDDGPGTYVVELDYGADAIESGQRRRIDLLRGGVRGAVHASWRNALGLTFVARRPSGAEPGITGLRARRHGLPARVDPQGIRRERFGRFVVERGYQIVDIYSSRDTYLNSALTDTAMSGRTILDHLGMAKRLSARVDRLYMGADEQLYWRELLPVVVANDGYGWIYLPEVRDPTEDEGDEETGKAMGRRYDVQVAGTFLLVGEQRGEQSYWHVFTAGQDYVTTVLKYGAARLERDAALLLLGLVDQVDG